MGARRQVRLLALGVGLALAMMACGGGEEAEEPVADAATAVEEPSAAEEPVADAATEPQADDADQAFEDEEAKSTAACAAATEVFRSRVDGEPQGQVPEGLCIVQLLDEAGGFAQMGMQVTIPQVPEGARGACGALAAGDLEAMMGADAEVVETPLGQGGIFEMEGSLQLFACDGTFLYQEQLMGPDATREFAFAILTAAADA